MVAGEEEDELQSLLSWVATHGLPKPELNVEISDPVTGQIQVVDATWPRGIQEGYSQPIALVVEANEAVALSLNQAGYRYFIGIEGLKRHLHELIENGSRQAA